MAFAYESHDHFVRDSKGNPVKTSNALKEEQEPKKPPTLEEGCAVQPTLNLPVELISNREALLFEVS